MYVFGILPDAEVWKFNPSVKQARFGRTSTCLFKIFHSFELLNGLLSPKYLNWFPRGTFFLSFSYRIEINLISFNAEVSL